MKIGPFNPNKPIANELEKKPKKPSGPDKSPSGDKDKLHISNEARLLAGEKKDETLKKAVNKADFTEKTDDNNKTETKGATSEQPLLNSEKINEIRAKIDSGFYERPEIKNKIAEKLADAIETDKDTDGEDDHSRNND